MAGPTPTGFRLFPASSPTARQVSNLLAIVLPFAAFVLAIVMLWGGPIQWIDLTVLVVGYVVTCLGARLATRTQSVPNHSQTGGQ
jgi:hypothetical protein